MKQTLYRKLEDGEIIESGDVDGEDGKWVSLLAIGQTFVSSAFVQVFRPVDVPEIPNPEAAIFTVNPSPESLTKRERFAMAAMQGILANPNVDPLKFGDKLISELAVFFADAQIAALNEREAA